jgi:hypothetical protein
MPGPNENEGGGGNIFTSVNSSHCAYTDAPFIPIPRYFLAYTQGAIQVDSAPNQRSGLEHIRIVLTGPRLYKVTDEDY